MFDTTHDRVADVNLETASSLDGDVPSTQSDAVSGLAARASAYSVVVSGISAVASYATNIALGRVSPAMLGSYTLMTTVAMFLATLLVFGGTNVVVHFTSGKQPVQRRQFMTSYGLVVAGLLALGTCVVLIFPGLLGDVFGSGIRGLSIPAIMVIVASSAVLSMSVAFSQSSLTMARAAIGQGLTSLCVALAVVATVVLGVLGPESLQLILALAWVVAAILGVFVCGFTFARPRLDLVRGTFWAYAAPFHLSTIAYFVVSNIDVMAASRTISVGSIGVYKVAMLARQLVQWIPMMVLAPAYALLRHCEVQGLQGEFDKLAERYVRVASAIAVVSAAVLLAASGLFLIAFGHGYSGAGVPLFVLVGASAVLLPSGTMAGAAAVAKGRIWSSLLVNIVTCVVGLPATVVASHAFGLTGLASGSVLTLLVSTALSAYLAARAGARLPLRYVAMSAVAIGAMVAVRATGGEGWLVSAGVLALGVGLPFAFRMLSFDDVRKLATQLVRR